MDRTDLIQQHFKLPSTEHEIHYSDWKRDGIRVFVKRDDLIHPFVSGNKWRKLQGYLQEAKIAHCERIITYGGAFSNHLLATAAAGAIFGIKTKGFVKSDHADLNNPVLTLCRIFGMECEKVSTESFNLMKREVPGAIGVDYIIPEGGYGSLGLAGCKKIMEELHQSYDHLFCAVGTGTTLAGICEAARDLHPDMQIHGIPVLKGADSLENEIRNLTHLGKFSLHQQYHHGGYAKVTSALVDFIKKFTAQTGILLDPVYTGKMFYALNDLITNGEIPEESKVLCLHTGGLTGLLNNTMLPWFSV